MNQFLVVGVWVLLGGVVWMTTTQNEMHDSYELHKKVYGSELRSTSKHKVRVSMVDSTLCLNSEMIELERYEELSSMYTQRISQLRSNAKHDKTSVSIELKGTNRLSALGMSPDKFLLTAITLPYLKEKNNISGELESLQDSLKLVCENNNTKEYWFTMSYNLPYDYYKFHASITYDKEKQKVVEINGETKRWVIQGIYIPEHSYNAIFQLFIIAE